VSAAPNSGLVITQNYSDVVISTSPVSSTIPNFVTSVAASGNLSVTNATTTPNIALSQNPTFNTVTASSFIGAGLGTVTGVTATVPLSSTGGAAPNISLTNPLPIVNGGTGTATPGLVAGTNITLTGVWPNTTINSSAFNPGWINVQNYLTQTIGALTASIVVPAVNSNVTVSVNTTAFTNGQKVCIWDYQYCISGLIISGGGTTTLVIQNTQLNGPSGGGPYSTTVGVTILPGAGSPAYGIQADDSVGILAAITAANALQNGTLFWPCGQYVTSVALTLAPNVSSILGGQCGIRPCGTVQNCFSISTGSAAGQFNPGTKCEIPSCFYFPGAAFYATDNNIAYARVYQNTVFRCGTGFLLTASTNGTAGTFGIIYQFQFIGNCTYGIHLVSTGGSKDGCQGLHFIGTMMIQNVYNVYFQSMNYATATASGYTLTLTSYTGNRFSNGDTLFLYDTTNKTAAYVLVTAGGGTSTITFSIISYTGGTFTNINVVPYFSSFGNHIFDLDGVNGNTNNTWGIVYDGGVFNQMYFHSTSSWGAFGTGQYLVKKNGGQCFNSCYDLQLYAAAGNLAPGYNDFTALQTPAPPFWSASNVIRTAYGGSIQTMMSPLTTPAATVANSRSTFNGGNAILSQRFHVSLTTNTAGGQVNDFYIYSPFTTGDSSNLLFTPDFDESATPYVFLSSVVDNSATNANEIRIRLVTPNTFSGTTVTVFGVIQIGQ
jgi:hypothetical protein